MINRDYLYTQLWADLSSVVLESKTLYFYAHDPEERSKYCASSLKTNNDQVAFIELTLTEQDQALVVGRNELIPLVSKKTVIEFVRKFAPTVVYIEVTGMSCRLIAPMLRYMIEEGLEVRIIYTEPLLYKLHEFKNVGVNKDLSEAVAGINPLPGFVTLANYRKEPLFVAMLGFEGGRLHYLISNNQPSYDKIRPIIGAPGYRMDYPFEAYWGNRYSLENTRAWEHVTFAEANSIVDAYLALKKISYDNRDPQMVVAPIGTKPHVIGAILYAIKNPTKVELLYDNPRRSVHRTDGIGKTLVCNVTKLFREN